MTDDTISDTERAEEQLYAAIDAEDLEHRSEDSIYIAVDPSEAQRVEAAIGATGASKTSLEKERQKENAVVDSVPELVIAQTSISQMEDKSSRLNDSQVPETKENPMAATTTDQRMAVEAPSSPRTSVSKAPPTTNPQEDSSQTAPTAIKSNAAASDNVPVDSEPSPLEVLSTAPEALPSKPPSESATTPSRGISTRIPEKKEPATLGEFVSLGDMEGRQHLRFSSKSPETKTLALSPIKDDVSAEPSVPPKPSKPAFTPFLSVFKDVASAPPSPSGSNSGRRDISKRKSPPPNDHANVPSEVGSERRRKRTRDTVSPASSAASFQTASSRIDEAMSRNKKSRRLADQLHDKPPGEGMLQVKGTAHASEAGDSSERMDTAKGAASNVADNGRTSPESTDMDIDDSQSPPPASEVQANSNSKPNGAAAFNPDQDDFMALDVSDEDDDDFRLSGFGKPDASRGQAGGRAPPQAFPDRGPSDKGKGKATGEAMCAECGGILAHSESCSKSLVCTSCKRTGHTSQYCSASWRDYVYHTPEEREAAINRKAAIAAEGGWKYEAAGVLVLDGTVGRCYNCGRTGHWGDDCPDPHQSGMRSPHTAFGRSNALLGPFDQDELSERDPEFVQSQKLLHESASTRGANLRPGMMGRERQKQIMRQQSNAARPAAAEEEDDWFDKANRGSNRFPGRGNRLGAPTGPRGGGRVNIQIRGMAGAGGSAGNGSQGSTPTLAQRMQPQDSRSNRNGNAGFDRRSNYPPNDRDNAAHSFYSSGQGGGSVADWEGDFRRSDQQFRPSGPAQGYGSQGSTRSGGHYRGGGRGYGNGGPRSGGHGGRQGYYGGY